MQAFGIVMAIFLVLIFLGMPIAATIGIATMAGFMAADIGIIQLTQICFTGLNNFTYIAIPLFILAGLIMERGGISRRLVDFCGALVGSHNGSLGVITILACTFFGAVCGSAPATCAAIGSMMIPSMVKKGYDINYAGGLTSCAGSIGILIPPSIPMIIYAVTAEISVSDIFLAGFAPGILVAIGLIIVNAVHCRRHPPQDGNQKFSLTVLAASFKEAFWALLSPVIILGGIYAGIFAATEAAVVAVIYSLVVGLFIYKETRFSEVYTIFANATITTGSTLLLLGFATAFARYLTMKNIPALVGEAILAVTNNPTVILVLFVIMIFFTGMFLETASQVLIYTPLFLPVLRTLGVDPLVFGLILVVGTAIGQVTPPVGLNLFVIKGITKTTLVDLSKHIWWFLFSMVIVDLILVFLPDVVLFLPRLTGYIG